MLYVSPAKHETVTPAVSGRHIFGFQSIYEGMHQFNSKFTESGFAQA